jgi:hypothetical protein
LDSSPYPRRRFCAAFFSFQYGYLRTDFVIAIQQI